MKEINLSQGLKSIVDDEDLDRLNQFNWFAHKSRNVFYAERKTPTVNGKRKIIKMHHDIIGKPQNGMVTDHEDGDGLNNQKYNLRNVTNRQNCQNRKHTPKTSQYPGVCWGKQNKKWNAQIYMNGGWKKLGYFTSEQEAFQAYQNAVESIGEKVIGL